MKLIKSQQKIVSTMVEKRLEKYRTSNFNLSDFTEKASVVLKPSLSKKKINIINLEKCYC